MTREMSFRSSKAQTKAKAFKLMRKALARRSATANELMRLLLEKGWGEADACDALKDFMNSGEVENYTLSEKPRGRIYATLSPTDPALTLPPGPPEEVRPDARGVPEIVWPDGTVISTDKTKMHFDPELARIAVNLAASGMDHNAAWREAERSLPDLPHAVFLCAFAAARSVLEDGR